MTPVERFRTTLHGWREERIEQLIDPLPIGDQPSDACWQAIQSGKLSTGEQVQLALAMAVLGYEGPARDLRLADILRLDNTNLLAVAAVFADLAKGR